MLEMKRLFFVLLAVLVAVTLCIPKAANATELAKQPNIMVFLIDDMGVMDTSLPFLTDADGQPKRYPLNDYYHTPGMERLAQQGIRFNQFYAMSVCSPTRISIMTGQNAARHRATNWINPANDNRGKYGASEWNWMGLKKGDVTLPGVLREQGYQTIHVGKGHFGPTKSEGADPANLGFDINVAGGAFGAPGSYFGEKHYGGASRRKHHAVPGLEAYHDTPTFLTEALTLEAKKVVSETVETGKPFYLYFAHYAVHAPFDSDPRFADRYKDSGKPANAQAFATLIEGMDKSLNDMLDHLDKIGEAENTLVLFLGDNGSDAPLGNQHTVACAAPLRGKKGAHYEGGMRVPFIAAWAKRNDDNPLQKQLQIPANVIQDQVASVCDLFPTIAQVTGTKMPAGHVIDGKPLQTLLTGQADSSRDEQFLMHYPHGVHRSNYYTVWRNGDWKAIYHALPSEKATGGSIQSTSHYQLFHLKDDPFESNDLAKKQPEVLKRMIGEMAEQLKAHQAVYPVDAAGKELPPVLPE